MLGGVAALLHPHDPALLDRAILDHRRLHLRTGQAAAFQKLLPWSAINALVTVDGLQSDRVRAVRSGRDLPIEMLTTIDPRGRRRLRAAAFQDFCHQGLSLALNGIHRALPRLAALNAMLERRYRITFSTNSYVSFARDSAFRPHWDDHDVLVLQIHGRKRWRCHGNPEGYPMAPKVFTPPGELGPVEWEEVLSPGDVLFVPRGDIHWGEVQGGHSAHLTIALLPPKGKEVMARLADLCVGHEAFRRDVLPFASQEDQRERGRDLARVFTEALEGLDLEEMFAPFDEEREPARPLNLGLDGALTAATEIHPTERRPGGPPVEAPVEAPVRFVGGEPRAALSDEGWRILSLLLARDGMRLGDLRAALPDMPASVVESTVGALARASMVWLFDE